METRVKREAAHYRVPHFATHGTFSNELAMYSHISLARNAGDPDDGQLGAREIADLDLDADVVVLSSCDTARGSVRLSTRQGRVRGPAPRVAHPTYR